MANLKEIAKNILIEAEKKNPFEWNTSRNMTTLFISNDVYTAIEMGSYMSKDAHDPINETIDYMNQLIVDANEGNNGVTLTDWKNWCNLILNEIDVEGHFDDFDENEKDEAIAEFNESSEMRGKVRDHLNSTMRDVAIEFEKQTEGLNESDKKVVLDFLENNVLHFVRNYFYDSDIEENYDDNNDRVDWKMYA